ncbi:MAG: rhomboid family intramembrane serine protease [Planctomycetota bacterium]
MGIFDRDYMRDSGSGSGPLSRLSGLQLVLGINVIVFLGWYLLPREIMVYHFMTSMAHVKELYLWTLLTAAFSHMDLWHFLINMLVLFSFSGPLEARWGKRRYLSFYLGAALFSSILHCSMAFFGFRDVPALGASGAVCAMTTAFAIYYPKAVIYLWGILPVPAWLLVGGFALFDIKGLVDQASGGGGNIGHAAHLGGTVFALIVIGVIAGNLLPRGGSGNTTVRRMTSATGRAPSDYYPQPSAPAERDLDEEMRLDELLTKVSRSGIDSLTDQEREDLRRIGEKRRDNS